jgi:hypothetical protein
MKVETGLMLAREDPLNDRIFLTIERPRRWWNYLTGAPVTTLEMTPGQAQTLALGIMDAVKRRERQRARLIVTPGQGA